MPYIPPEDNDGLEPESGKAPPGGIVSGSNNGVGNLNTAELAANLAASGQRLVTEDEAALELARRRRRGGQSGVMTTSPADNTAPQDNRRANRSATITSSRGRRA